VGGSIAGVGFFVLLVTGYLQWRSVNRLAEVSALVQSNRLALPTAGSSSAAQLLGEGETGQANGRLFGALSQLEKRILELEHTAHVASEAKALTTGTGTNGNGQHDLSSPQAAHDSVLLAKGQSLLDQDKPQEALGCFEEVLKAEPHHGEALVKRGLALEALQRPEEALACYNQAIAANADLTIAFLQKGGLLNRLERYEEALQCYELALHAQEKAHAV
jgi:tetratricopeptide (TPR) repeat protein